MAKKKSSPTKRITNRRARYDYELGDELVAGIVLTGGETKALRRGQGNLRGAYVVARENELWLVNATITGDGSIVVPESDQTRTRKLLAKKREIDSLLSAKQQGKTIIPLDIMTGGRYIKVRIAIGRGKKKYDKRQSLKKRDEERQMNTIRRG